MKNISVVKFALVPVVVSLALPAYAGTQVRRYSAAITPTSVPAGTTQAFALTITNDGESTHPFGSAYVAVPSAFTLDAASLSISVTGGKEWTAQFGAGTITLGPDPGTQKVDAGESITISFNATAPCAAGTHEWTTSVYQSTVSDGQSTPYTLSGAQPSVTVEGTCSALIPFSTGEYCTYTQGGWGANPNGNNPGQILAANFATVYPSGVHVGNPHSMTFSGAGVVTAYLPAGGSPGTLLADVTDPTSTSAGVFGGQVLALRINVDFSAAGITAGFGGPASALKLTNTGQSLDGKSISEILSMAENALGGGSLPTGYSLSELSSLADLLNQAFDNCVPSEWAQTHLSRP